MLQEYQQLKISEYQNLYDRLIPESHVLRKFNNLMDFSFVRDELEHKYCLNNGRNAISPVMLFKYLILKAYYTMSDADLVERSKYDMSFKYFLGLRPEDDVIHSSTLTKFRKLRLADENILDLLIEKTVAIAIEKGIIKEMLTAEEVKWFNDYHQTVYKKLSPSLNEEEKKWLLEATKAI